jgi:peptidoglycan/xylan/chitin deacetylase (PgdA/CDA1 family)
VSRHLVCLTVDFDSISLWMALGQTTPTPISRGEFGAVAAGRVLELFAAHEVRSTWFIPGLTIDTYEDVCRNVVRAGHEVGHHGYDHIAPGALSREEELDQLRRGNAAIERIAGRRARGYRSPAWDLSAHSVELLIGEGFVYDSSMMGHDHRPYRARSGDVIQAGKAPVFGAETTMWELPISWSADDFPHFEYYRGSGLSAASLVLENWIEDFSYMQQSCEVGVLTYTLHPFVIGRGHRMRMLERLILALKERGAVFVTAEQAIEEFRDL